MKKEDIEYSNSAPMSPYVKGYQQLCEKRVVLDFQTCPFLKAAYALAIESEWGTSGGIKKDIVLFKINQNGSKEEKKREIITHQFDRSKDCLENFRITNLQITINLNIVDLTTYYKKNQHFQEGEVQVCGRSGQSKVSLRIKHTQEKIAGNGNIIYPSFERKIETTLKEEEYDISKMSRAKVCEHLKRFGINKETYEKIEISYYLINFF